jgi:hypothetical protein
MQPMNSYKVNDAMTVKEMLQESGALFAGSTVPIGADLCRIALAEIERLERELASCRGPESEAVKLLRRCHDAGDLVTPLDETLREDVAAFFGGKDG